MPDSFPQILSALQRGVSLRWRALFVGLFVLSGIVFAVQQVRQWDIARYQERLFDQENVNVDVTQLQQLLQKKERGDATVDSQIQHIRSRLALRLSLMTGDARAWQYILALPISFLLSFFLIVCCYVGGFAYAVLLAIEPHLHARRAALWAMRSLPAVLVTLILLFLWSFLWIPLTGIILEAWRFGSLRHAFLLILFGYFIAILLLPRVVLAPFFLLSEHTGPLRSVQRSITASRGYWGKILGNTLLFLLLLLIGNTAIQTAVASLVPVVPVIQFLHLFLGLLSMALLGFFLAELTRIVVAKPYVATEA